MTPMLITGLVVILLLLVLVSSLRIHFFYEHRGGADRLSVGITWLRYLTFTLSEPRADLCKRPPQGTCLRLKAGGLKERAIPLGGMLRLGMANLARLKRSFKYAAAHTRIKRLEWSSEFSLGDAACTGVTAGLVWSLKSTLLTVVSSHTRLETVPRIRVRPNFQEPLFHTLINCIFEIRIGHIMIAGIKAVRPG